MQPILTKFSRIKNVATGADNKSVTSADFESVGQGHHL